MPILYPFIYTNNMLVIPTDYIKNHKSASIGIISQ